MPRFLHTADWQIGRQYSEFAPDDAVPLADARLLAVETIARLASEHTVDAVLVAGDVFDAQTIGERTMFDGMQSFPIHRFRSVTTTMRPPPRVFRFGPVPGV